MIQTLLIAMIGNRFDTAAGISRQIGANLGKEVSRHTRSRRMSQVELKARSPAIKPHISQKNGVSRHIFSEEHVTWTDDDRSKGHLSMPRTLLNSDEEASWFGAYSLQPDWSTSYA